MTNSPVECELDLDVGYIESVLMDFDSFKTPSNARFWWVPPWYLGQLSKFNMTSKMVGIPAILKGIPYKILTITKSAYF